MFCTLVMWKNTAGAVHRVGADHRVHHRLAVFLLVLGAGVLAADVEHVDRPHRRQALLLVRVQRIIGRAHAGDAGAASGRGNFDPIEHRRQWRLFVVGVVGVPILRDLLAVLVVDEADVLVAGHVVLRVVLAHHRAERGRRRQVLVWVQILVGEDQRQVLGQRLRQRLPGFGVGRLGEVDPGHFRPDHRVQLSDCQFRHRTLP